MRHLLMVALLSLLPVYAEAQELTVVSFGEAPIGGNIMTTDIQVEDLNKDICALVKVMLPVEGADFEGGIVRKEFHTNHYWVYMPKGEKRLTVLCPGREPLRVEFAEYIGNEGLKRKTIYELKLTGYQTDTNGSALVEAETHQYLVLTVSPKNARVEIDGEERVLDENGEGSYYMAKGMHTYTVSAPGYVSQSGRVEIDQRQALEISLESTMARLRLTCETPGVSFYINEQHKGTGNWTGNLYADTYRVEARKEGYRTQSRTVTLQERGEETIAFPALEEITGSLRVDYKPVNTEVWIDGEKAGLSPDRFSVLVGSHKVELRKDGYASKTESVSVKEGEETLIGGTLSKDSIETVSSQDDAEWQNEQGEKYYYGRGVERDYAKAVEWYRKSAEQGNAAAQSNLGYCYEHGHGVERDYAKAVEWYRKSAEQGNATAQYNLGYCYYEGQGVELDYAKAVEWYRKSAEQGNAGAQYNLGYCYGNGFGVEQNYAKAVEWFRKSAAQGNADAQCILGLFYTLGRGVRQDYAKAVEWFRKSAAQGNVMGQNSLGYSYMYGLGVEQDYAKAVEWYRKSAEQGNAMGQSNLGYCYEHGQGVERDYAKAVEWYRKAAAQGDADAQNNLGSCYHNGHGVERDYAKAVEWYRKAAAQGNETAKINLRNLGESY